MIVNLIFSIIINIVKAHDKKKVGAGEIETGFLRLQVLRRKLVK